MRKGWNLLLSGAKPDTIQPSVGGWQFYHGPQIMTSTRLIFEIFLVLMWRPYRVLFCLLHILLYLIRQITGSDLSQTYVRKHYLHLSNRADAGVSRGSSCVCTCISNVAMTLSEVLFFFLSEGWPISCDSCTHLTPTPRVFYDEGYWFPLYLDKIQAWTRYSFE